MTCRIMCVHRPSDEYTDEVKDWFLRQLPDCEVLNLKYNYAGWWSKMELFRPDIKGDILYFDLDTVIQGDIEKYTKLKETHVLSDFYYPDKSIGSGMMFLKESDRAAVWEEWLKIPQTHMKSYRGDQNFLNQFFWKSKRWQNEFEGEILSYKVHVKNENRFFKGGYNVNDANVICFHGQPRPWKVREYA